MRGSMTFFGLRMDETFQDFNFSENYEPSLTCGPSQVQLIEMAYKARKGSSSAAWDFADSMYWTLREPAFDAFQQRHGPRPIHYREWFHAKLCQFLDILIYEQLQVLGSWEEGGLHEPRSDRPWEEGFRMVGIDPPAPTEEVESAFVPEDNESDTWEELVGELSRTERNRLTVLSEILAKRIKEAPSTRQPGREWVKTQDRNRIIRNLLERGESRERICEELDRQSIPTLPSMQERGVHNWVQGWGDPEFRKAIQRMISKVARAANLVKS